MGHPDAEVTSVNPEDARLVAEKEARLAEGEVRERDVADLDSFEYHTFLNARPDGYEELLNLWKPSKNY